MEEDQTIYSNSELTSIAQLALHDDAPTNISIHNQMFEIVETSTPLTSDS